MSRKKNDHFAQAVVGLFMIVVIALLGYFTIVISGIDVLTGRNRVNAQIAFDEVGGLKNRDSVMYRGTKVGTVESVAVTPSNLVVKIEIDGGVVIREKYRVAVCNLSMLGGNYLLLEEGVGEPIDYTSVMLSGETPSDWMRDISAIAKNIKAVTEMKEVKGIVTNFEAAAEKASRLADTANRIADRVERGEGTVGKLLSSDDTVYNDLKRTLASAADIAERINRGEGTVGKLLSKDDTLHGEIKDSLAAFRKAVSSFDLGDTKGGISNLVANADKLMVNLNAVADKIKKGEGTLGKLTSDPELYDEANALVKDIRQVVDNYRDSTPITTFSSLIMGGL